MGRYPERVRDLPRWSGMSTGGNCGEPQMERLGERFNVRGETKTRVNYSRASSSLQINWTRHPSVAVIHNAGRETKIELRAFEARQDAQGSAPTHLRT
jgi:hypothetical protein